MSNVIELKPAAERELDQLGAAWLQAKAEEAEANKRRVAIEEQIVARVGVKDEGTFSASTSHFKFSTTGRVTRTLDADALHGLDAVIPAAILQRLVEYKPSLRLAELRYIENNEPDYYRAFSKALTVKPAKPGVKIEEIE